MHSNLSIDVFKKYFSYFCLTSYYDEKIEFTDGEIKRYIARGLKIENAKVNKDHFLRDLQESVCVIQRDGLNLVFTHRTFQEFFVAYCLARLSKKHFRPIIEKIANRWSDNVMQMLYDMNNDLLETEYLLPAAQELLSSFDRAVEKVDYLHKYCEGRNMRVLISHDEEPRFIGDDRNTIRGVLRQLFRKEFKTAVAAKFARYRRLDRIAMKEAGGALLKETGQKSLVLEIQVEPSGECTASVQSRNGLTGPTVNAEWFRKSGFASYAHDEMDFVRAVTDRLSEKAAKRNTTLEKLFGIED